MPNVYINKDEHQALLNASEYLSQLLQNDPDDESEESIVECKAGIESLVFKSKIGKRVQMQSREIDKQLRKFKEPLYKA